MYFLCQSLKNYPEQKDLYKQSMRIGKGTEINAEPLIWEKLEHHVSYVILPESYLIVSEISTQHLPIGIIPMLVSAQLMISRTITQQEILPSNDASLGTLNWKA